MALINFIIDVVIAFFSQHTTMPLTINLICGENAIFAYNWCDSQANNLVVSIDLVFVSLSLSPSFSILYHGQRLFCSL